MAKLWQSIQPGAPVHGGFDYNADIYALVVLTGLYLFPNPSKGSSLGVESLAITDSVSCPYAGLITRP
jgi:hypothetical protein